MESPAQDRSLILKKLKQCFPDPDTASSALVLLDSYGSMKSEPQRERVQLALLKLSGGDIAQLTDYLCVAKKDYRDVLAWAESPNAMSNPQMDPGSREQVDQADRQQYLDWLYGNEC